MAGEIEAYVRPLVAIVVGVALVPVVQAYVEGANLTGTTKTLVSLIPFFYGLSVFLGAIKGIML